MGTVLDAELWGIFWGLSLAWDAGYQAVELQCDSSVAMNLINKPTSANHPLANIISCCKLKTHGDWHCVVRHFCREMNTVADAMATKSADLGLSCFIYGPNVPYRHSGCWCYWYPQSLHSPFLVSLLLGFCPSCYRKKSTHTLSVMGLPGITVFATIVCHGMAWHLLELELLGWLHTHPKTLTSPSLPRDCFDIPS